MPLKLTTEKFIIKTWRAKQYRVKVSPHHRLVLTVRTFRPAKARRSKKYKQLVVPVYLGSVRQIAIRNQRFGRRGQQPAIINTIRNSAAAPIILIFIGVAGLAFFGAQASQGQHIKAAKSFGKPIEDGLQ